MFYNFLAHYRSNSHQTRRHYAIYGACVRHIYESELLKNDQREQLTFNVDPTHNHNAITKVDCCSL